MKRYRLHKPVAALYAAFTTAILCTGIPMVEKTGQIESILNEIDTLNGQAVERLHPSLDVHFKLASLCIELHEQERAAQHALSGDGTGHANNSEQIRTAAYDNSPAEMALCP